MAKIINFSQEEQAEWDEWLAGRPECIKKMVKSHPPTNLYMITETQKRCFIEAYSEDNTVRVFIPERFNKNLLMGEYGIFGVPLNRLVECDYPEGFDIFQLEVSCDT